jgi:hypothetical protein
MKPLNIIYWSRAALGIVIGILCGIYIYFSVSDELFSLFTLLTGVSFAMLFYLATYYVIKLKFFGRIEKPRKLVMQGIGIYFFAWVVAWTLIVTLLMPTVSISVYDTSSGELLEDHNFFVFAKNNGNSQWKLNITENVFRRTSPTGSYTITLLPPGNYTFELGNLVGYSTDNQNSTLIVGWLENLNVRFNVTQISG